MSNLLENRIAGSLLGTAVGSIYGRFVEHRAWRKPMSERQAAAQTFPADAAGLAWGEYGVDFNAQMLIVARALLEHDGLPTVEQLARVWMREADPLAFGDGEVTICPPAKPIRYALRNTWELLRMGTPPRAVGGLNVPILSGIYVVGPVAAVNACDPDQAYLDAVALSSLFQRDRGTVVPGILAAMTAEALRPGATVETVLDIALRKAQAAEQGPRSPLPVESAAFVVHESIRAGRYAADGADLFHRLRSITKRYSRRDPYKTLALTVAVCAFASDSLCRAVETGVLEAQSPDVLAACCGMIVGALQGEQAIPTDWMHFLGALPIGQMVRDLAVELTGLVVRRARHRRHLAQSLLFDVRAMKPDEVEQVCEADREAFLNSRYGEMTARRTLKPEALQNWQSIQDFRSYCTEHPDRVMVAMVGDSVAGFGTIGFEEEANVGKIVNCAVRPAYRGMGIGVAVVKRLLHELKSRGINRVKVTTSHVPEACRMYEKAGFQLVLKRLDHGQDGKPFYTSKYELTF